MSEPTSDQSPSTAGAGGGTRRDEYVRIGAACAVGLVVGLIIGMSLRSAPEAVPSVITGAAPGDHVPSGRPGVPTSQAKPAPAAISLDAGSAEVAPLLQGDWKRQQQLDHRSVALATSSNARVELQTPLPLHQPFMSVVVRAVGIPSHQRLPVDVAVNGHHVARWAVTSEWMVIGAPVPAEIPIKPRTTIAFAVDTKAVAKKGPDKPSKSPEPPPIEPPPVVAVAVDHFRIAPLYEADEFELTSLDVRSRLLTGFSDTPPGTAPVDSVWSSGSPSVAAMLLWPADLPYTLTVLGYPYKDVVPSEMTVHVNGHAVGPAKLERQGSQVHRISVPHKLLVDGVNTVSIKYAKTIRPADIDKESLETRFLAFRYYGLSLAPSGP